jgi:hypothetical protein
MVRPPELGGCPSSGWSGRTWSVGVLPLDGQMFVNVV